MNLSRFWGGCLGLAMPLTVLAAASVESVTGDVRAVTPGASQVSISKGAKIVSGMTVTTGDNAQVTLRLEDGGTVVLHQNTGFKVTEFSFSKGEPAKDRAEFGLEKGALRMVSGTMGKRSRNAVALRVPQATLRIRDTDFMVVLVNPAFVSVLSGTMGVTSGPGTVAFGAGSLGSVASSTSLATSISASALPGAASSAFGSLGRVLAQATPGTPAPGTETPAPGTEAAGAEGAAGAGGAAGGLGGAALAAAAVAAGLAAAAGGGGTTTTHATTTHH